MKEDLLHQQIANYLKIIEKQQNIVFWSYMPFGEKRNITTGALLKKKGTKKGVPDFLLILQSNKNKCETLNLWIECKVGFNKQTVEQKDFQKNIERFDNQFYYLIKSLDDLIEIFNNINNVRS